MSSKVLEKVVYKRLYSFLTHHRILYGRQYCFRPARSAIDAITEFTTDVLLCLDKREKCIFLCIWTSPRPLILLIII